MNKRQTHSFLMVIMLSISAITFLYSASVSLKFYNSFSTEQCYVNSVQLEQKSVEKFIFFILTWNVTWHNKEGFIFVKESDPQQAQNYFTQFTSNKSYPCDISEGDITTVIWKKNLDPFIILRFVFGIIFVVSGIVFFVIGLKKCIEYKKDQALLN